MALDSAGNPIPPGYYQDSSGAIVPIGEGTGIPWGGTGSGGSTPAPAPFIDAEDIVSGRAETDANPKYAFREYDGEETGEFEFVANGPPFVGGMLRAVIKDTLERNGLEYITVTTLETRDIQILGVPVYGNYKMRVVYHGSPALAIAPVMWLIFAAIAVIGVTIVVWQITQAIKSANEVRKMDITRQVIEAMPEDTPAERAAKAEAAQKAVGAFVAPGGPMVNPGSSADPFGSLGDLGKVALWGGVAVLAIMALGAAKDLKGKTA